MSDTNSTTDREAGTRPVPEYTRELAAQLDDARAQGRAAILGHITTDSPRDLDLYSSTRDALDRLAEVARQPRLSVQPSPLEKWAVCQAVERMLTHEAMHLTFRHGPMSEGRAELVIARAELTLAGRHAAADAIGRELAGTR